MLLILSLKLLQLEFLPGSSLSERGITSGAEWTVQTDHPKRGDEITENKIPPSRTPHPLAMAPLPFWRFPLKISRNQQFQIPKIITCNWMVPHQRKNAPNVAVDGFGKHVADKMSSPTSSHWTSQNGYDRHVLAH
jgi:hypothetical protein